MRTESCERSGAPSSGRWFPHPVRSPAAPLPRARSLPSWAASRSPSPETKRPVPPTVPARGAADPQGNRKGGAGGAGRRAGAAGASWAGCGSRRFGRRRGAGGTRLPFFSSSAGLAGKCAASRTRSAAPAVPEGRIVAPKRRLGVSAIRRDRVRRRCAGTAAAARRDSGGRGGRLSSGLGGGSRRGSLGTRSGLAPGSGRPDRGRAHRAGGGGCCGRAAPGAAQTSSSRGRGPGRLGWKEEGPGGGGGIGRSRGGAACEETGGRVRGEDRRRAPAGEAADGGGLCLSKRIGEARGGERRRRPGAEPAPLGAHFRGGRSLRCPSGPSPRGQAQLPSDPASVEPDLYQGPPFSPSAPPTLGADFHYLGANRTRLGPKAGEGQGWETIALLWPPTPPLHPRTLMGARSCSGSPVFLAMPSWQECQASELELLSLKSSTLEIDRNKGTHL